MSEKKAVGGISAFIVANADLSAAVPSVEIVRLVEASKQQGTPFTNVQIKGAYFHLKGNRKVKRQTIVAKKSVLVTAEASEPIARMSRNSDEFFQKLEELLKKFEEDNTRAAEEIQRLRTKLEAHRQQTVAMRIQILLYLSKDLTDQPQVLRSILDAKERIEALEKELPKDFPRESKKPRLPMRYEVSFLVAYWKLGPEDQHKVTKALNHLAEHGEHAPSLRAKLATSSLPGQPPRTWWCLAYKETFFSCVKESSKTTDIAVVIGDLIHKG